MIAHCLFEQSGTFKNEFKKLGFEAFDYDICDDYGQTDFQLDLFEEIERAYNGGASIFDNIKSSDLVFAFFPCTRFECQVTINFRGEAPQQKKWSDIKKLEYDLKLHEELTRNYNTITKMAIICLKKSIPLVIENPANKPHYLSNYWALKPAIIDKDRSENGDYMKKPTQYWFIGFEPKNNLVFEALEMTERRRHEFMKCEGTGKTIKTLRSEIHPQYASRFIRQYILEG